MQENYQVTAGPFYNLAKTYWTFRIQLDEDVERERENLPLFYLILRDVEINIAGAFFPTGGQVNESNQRQTIKEFAPEIDIESFINDNPMMRFKKEGWLRRLLKKI